jgi:SPOR domain
MMNRDKYLLPLPLCVTLAMTACGSANTDWANARAENTVAAYKSFLNRHDGGDPHTEEARARIAALQDNAAWKTAESGNSPHSYRQYLQNVPHGTHVQAARDRITEMERAIAWKSAQSSATALEGFLQKYPQGPEADQARQKLLALNFDYRAELGIFHTEHAAKRKRSELQSQFSSVLKEVDVLSPDPSNKRYRVMSGLMDRHDARSVCASLKRTHQACEVVKADQQLS